MIPGEGTVSAVDLERWQPVLDAFKAATIICEHPDCSNEAQRGRDVHTPFGIPVVCADHAATLARAQTGDEFGWVVDVLRHGPHTSRGLRELWLATGRPDGWDEIRDQPERLLELLGNIPEDVR